MRARNRTGICQTISGTRMPPGVWMQIPQDVPLQVAFSAWAFGKRRVELKFDPGDPFEEGVFWIGPFSKGDGYATANEATLRALVDLGVKLFVHPAWFTDDMSSFAEELVKNQLTGPKRVGVCMATPGEFRKLPTPYRIGLTMYEADNPLEHHPEWRHECAQVDRLIVPSEYCERVFRAFFKGPIDVAPLAIDPTYYTARKREAKDTFTFGMHGTLSGRKAPLELIKTFQAAFPDEQDVRLDLKTRLGVLGWKQGQLPTLTDSRVNVINETWDSDRVRDWMHGLDAYVFPSKGEGYGMPPREAVCTGLPTIISGHTGMMSLADCPDVWAAPTGSEEESPLGGLWRIPDWDYVVDCMRWIYNNREKAYESGVSAAHWYMQNMGNKAIGQRIKDILDGVDPVSSRVDAPPGEEFGMLTAMTHKPFFDILESIGGPFIDIGVGEAIGYITLVKRGHKVTGLVSQEGYARARAAIEAVGLKPNLRIIDLLSMSSYRMPSGACYSLCSLQDYTSLEIRVLMRQAKLVSQNVVVSIPSVHYPTQYASDSYLWRLNHWRDILTPWRPECRYYARKKYVLAILGDGTGASRKSAGIMVDGTWHPREGENDA